MTRPTLPTRLRAEDGFTLIEMLTVVAILAVVFGVFAAIMSTTARNNAELTQGSVLQGEAGAALDRIAEELRQAYTGDDTFPIVAATATTLEFYSPDTVQPFHLRRIAYRLTGGRLERAVVTSSDTDGAPWTGLGTTPSNWVTQLDSITNAGAFTYTDANGAVATTPSAVRRVSITLTVATKANPVRRNTYQANATLRLGS
jgi:prepilin-type N-terminal cleavage/methylation domain-containing protein